VNAELLLDGRMPGDADRLGLQAILDSGTGAVELTSQLFAVTRHRPVAPEVFDPNEAIRWIQPMLAPMSGEDVRLIARLGRSPVLVWADPGRIDQVLLNLVMIARDAMPVGEKVTIGTDVVLRRIFEPSYSTKGEGLGSGLGLTTVCGSIEQAGGHTEVESSPGVGPTFQVLLPVAEPQPDAPEAVAAAPVEILPVGSTVLVVEDEELVRSLAVRSLQRAGFIVVAADSVVSAIAVAADPSQIIDLVITEVVLAGGRASQLVEGVELLAKPYRPVELVARALALLGLDQTDLGAVPMHATRPTPS
jgi:two-component system cell cycle sensor histidine kinase/response regulator CckA